MRQAIEEGFILNVLANYTTYKAYWRLLKKIEDDPRYDKKQGRVSAQVVSSSCTRTPSREKVAVCVEHFAAQVTAGNRRAGQGDDRDAFALHAVRTKLALDRLPRRKGTSLEERSSPSPAR